MSEPPIRHHLTPEPMVERISWILTGAVMALSVLALLTTNRSQDAAVDTAPESTQPATATDPAGEADTDGRAREGAAPDSRRFVISASGDIIVHGRVADAARTDDGYDFTPLFANIRPVIEAADLAICHLEVPVSLTNTDLAFGEAGAFRVPNQIVDALAATGFESCSAASNHAYDSGEPSVLATVEQLGRVGLPHVGIAASAEQAATLWQFEVNGTTVGHLAYTYGLNGRAPGSVPTDRVAQIDEATILADAARHKANGSEFVVVSMHWGDEFVSELNELQAELGPRLIASDDIDLIIGHSAHVPQQIVEYDGEYVAYGLGNLLSNQSVTAPECPTACTLESQDGVLVDFAVDQVGTELRVVEVTARPTWVDVGSTWQIFDTTASQTVTGAAFDRDLLDASFDRTMRTLGIAARVP